MERNRPAQPVQRSRVPALTRLSLYFPWSEVLVDYQKLAFPRDTGWGRVLELYIERPAGNSALQRTLEEGRVAENDGRTLGRLFHRRWRTAGLSFIRRRGTVRGLGLNSVRSGGLDKVRSGGSTRSGAAGSTRFAVVGSTRCGWSSAQLDEEFPGRLLPALRRQRRRRREAEGAVGSARAQHISEELAVPAKKCWRMHSTIWTRRERRTHGGLCGGSKRLSRKSR